MFVKEMDGAGLGPGSAPVLAETIWGRVLVIAIVLELDDPKQAWGCGLGVRCMGEPGFRLVFS